MRLYRRSKKIDLNDTIALCDFDADHGRVTWALDRLRDLEEELGPDAKISYAEGLLRCDFLGQGKQAFECFVRAQGIGPSHRLSACNAAWFSPSEQEFGKWAAVASRVSPADAPAFEDWIRALSESKTYRELQFHVAVAAGQNGKHGDAAAHLELALGNGYMEESEEVKVRRTRAQSLREVDREAQSLRDSAGERFPADERLSLREAVLELDRAIALDEYDAELWNLRSSWCVLLQRNEEAVAASTRSIALRPTGYAKPYHNWAMALWNQGRDRDAIDMANRAIAVASAAGADADLRLAQSILEGFLNGRHQKGQVIWSARKILNGTGVRTHQFAERTGSTVPDLCNAFAGRLTAVKAGTSLDYVAPLGQLLAYYPVEASATVMRFLRDGDPIAADKCSEALTYIIANAEPVMQRDAARVRSLLVLDQPDLERMRRAFRELVLVPATAGAGEFHVLLDVVRDQLLRLTDQRGEILGNQPTPTDVELNSAQAGLLQRLRGTPFVNDSRNFGEAASQAPGCSLFLLLGLLVPVALLALLIEQ